MCSMGEVPDLERLRAAVLDWSCDWGEDHPHHVRLVETTRDAATRALHDGGLVRSTQERIYFVVVRGSFTKLLVSGNTRSGVWAGLLIEQERLRVTTFTVRPEVGIPLASALDSLGEYFPL
ncbi:hypothetical protein ACYSUO_39385 [Streptomyces sp. UC4497]